jgi:hypothetical protein
MAADALLLLKMVIDVFTLRPFKFPPKSINFMKLHHVSYDVPEVQGC